MCRERPPWPGPQRPLAPAAGMDPPRPPGLGAALPRPPPLPFPSLPFNSPPFPPPLGSVRPQAGQGVLVAATARWEPSERPHCAQRHGPRGGGGGGRRGGRERRAAAGDRGLSAQPQPAGPLPLPALPDPAGRAALDARGRFGPAAAAQDEAPRLHPGAAAAFRRRQRPAHPHGRQRQSLRRDPRQEVLRAR